MRDTLFTTLAFAAVLAAQQPVAPTPEPVGSTRGQNWDGYNVVNSFETGYRFSLVDGDLGKYRSDVNYRNGIRLLGSSLSINSRAGHGRFFDEILLNTQGLGNDPYEAAVLRVQKNRLYRYDMLWRMDEYYNPGLVPSAGQHLLDTRRRMQDHDLVLLPQSRFRFRLGYTRNNQDGPALSTIQVFDARGDEFPLFADVRRVRNEYRLGADAEFAGFKLTLLHRWDYFKEDTPYTLDGSTQGNNPNDGVTLNQFRRSEPYHGSSPSWFGNLHTDRKFWGANARITYVGGQRDFIMDELALGTDRFGGARNRQVVVDGNARRPVVAGDFSFTLFPGDRLTLVNNTSVHSTRIDGDARYLEFNNATQSASQLYFRFLGVRTVANATDAHYRVTRSFGIYAGYHYSSRLIRAVESFDIPPFGGDRSAYEQENHLHSGLLGVRWKPWKPLTINVDGEIGRADHPFTPIAENRYHAVSGRVEYRVRSATLSVAYRENYNFNSVALPVHSARARNYSANASWAGRAWFSLDAGYTRLHLDTVSGLAFFAGLARPSLVDTVNSIYVSNIHSGNLAAHFTIRKRVDLFAGYSITKDTGDGRGAAVTGTTDAIGNVFIPVQTFPLSFQSPMARVSVRIGPKLRWNAGWQFYRYREDFGLLSLLQNYRAHTGYTSLLWSF